jgi:hypothetical protein
MFLAPYRRICRRMGGSAVAAMNRAAWYWVSAMAVSRLRAQ